VRILLYGSQEFQKLHYFAVTRWEREIRPREAEAVRWIPRKALATLKLDVDRMAVAEYMRVYRPRVPCRAYSAMSPGAWVLI